MAEKTASYQLGVEETEIRLVKELSEVCRNYCNMTWDKALTAVGVLADSTLRLPGSVYYHPQIQEIPSTSSSLAPIPEPFGQPLVVPDALPPPKIPMECSQAGDKGQGAKGEKARTKGRSHQPKPNMLQKRRKQRPKIRRLIPRPRMLFALS